MDVCGCDYWRWLYWRGVFCRAYGVWVYRDQVVGQWCQCLSIGVVLFAV